MLFPAHDTNAGASATEVTPSRRSGSELSSGKENHHSAVLGVQSPLECVPTR